MNILDHRILVPQSASDIWDYISDFSKNPVWQVDTASVSFLTSRRDGIGVRWRYTTANGREYVAETTAWYDGLGYEYTIVDGASFRENKGRLRLQEIAEGTIVQWTFSYEVGGFLGGMRNAVLLRRQVENSMVDSLKMLWRVMNQAGGERVREVKSLMQDAPNYEARAHYKPRHPSKVERAAEQVSGDDEPMTITEPAFSDEDTRPRVPVVAAAPETPEPDGIETSEPEQSAANGVTASVDEAVVEEIDYAKTPSPDEVSVVEDITPTVSLEDAFTLADEPEKLPGSIYPPSLLPEQPVFVDITSDSPAPLLSAEAVTPAPEPDNKAEAVLSAPEPDTDAAAALPTPESDTDVEAVMPEPDNGESVVFEVTSEVPQATTTAQQAKTNTAEISVFEIFGLPKPSETQEMRSVALTEPSLEVIKPLAAPIVAPFGLRRVLRRKRVKLRVRSQ
jgi:hypothetical protein